MRIPTFTRLLMVLGAAILALTPIVKAQAGETAGMMLEKAIQKELITGDLRGVIADFERVLTRFPDDAIVAPQALWHLGQAYERLGDSRARQVYERLVQRFGAHKHATSARNRLETMFDEAEGDPAEAVVAEDWARPTQLVRSGNNGQGPEVIFTDLAVFNRDSGEVKRLTSSARAAAYPVLAPGGQRVAYLSWSGDLKELLTEGAPSRRVRNRSLTELRVVGIKGEDDRVIFRSENIPWLRPFAWSPDARQILTIFERNDGRREIALISATDGSVRTLASPPWLSPQGMGFSPDGSYIAYQIATPRSSRQWDFFIRPIEAPAPAPIVERRYSISLAGQRAAILSEDQMVIHVLNRLGFGPRPGDIERVKAMGIEAYIEQQLQPEKIADPVVDAKLAGFTTLKMDIPTLQRTLGPPAPVADRRRVSIFDRARMAASETPVGQLVVDANRPRDYENAEARMIRAMFSERQLQEVVVDFWMNHFNVRLGDHQHGPHYEEQVIRRHAFGKFEDLLRAVATHPRMLVYLDNWKSSAPADVVMKRVDALKASAQGDAYIDVLARLPFYKESKGLNENFARELMELHTLGVDGGYTQQDVQEVARILTGWTISGRGLANGREDDGVFYFDPIMHVEGDKRVLGRTIPSGGMDEGEQLLKMLAAHSSTARFISTKLARRFIADDPPPAVIEAASRTFLRTGGDIREVLRTIITSPQFRSPEAFQAKIKKPLELVVSALRAVNADVATSSYTEGLSSLLNGNRGAVTRMGERVYNYDAPDGNPDVAGAWINSNALLARIDFANTLATGQLIGIRPDLRTAQRLLEQLGMPRPTASQVEQTRAMMQAANAASGGAAPQMSSTMMNAGTAAAGAAAPVDPAAVVVAAMLGSPQFQKR